MGSFNRQDLNAARRRRLLASYQLIDCERVPVRRLICEDIKRFEEMGALCYATDLTIVLSIYDAEFFARPTVLRPRRRSSSVNTSGAVSAQRSQT